MVYEMREFLLGSWKETSSNSFALRDNVQDCTQQQKLPEINYKYLLVVNETDKSNDRQIGRYFIRHRIHKPKSLIYNEAVHLKYENINTQIYILIQYKH